MPLNKIRKIELPDCGYKYYELPSKRKIRKQGLKKPCDNIIQIDIDGFLPYMCDGEKELIYINGNETLFWYCFTCGKLEKYFPEFGLDYLELDEEIGKPRGIHKGKKRKEVI